MSVSRYTANLLLASIVNLLLFIHVTIALVVLNHCQIFIYLHPHEETVVKVGT
jgi:hypothetical protein